MANYRDGHTTKKHGTFEWIVGWEELAAHLAPPAVLGLAPGARAVDLGCGTSEVPVHLAASGYAHVLAVDRDVGCIAHMHSRHGAVPGLAWRECDLVDGDLAALLPGGSADLLLDKGTLDCALTEDTVAALLCTVHGILSAGGVYVAISFRPAALLLPLLSCAELQMEPPELVHITARAGEDATLCRLRKRATATKPPQLAPVAAATGAVLDWWYREQQPLLTAERRGLLAADWAAAVAAAAAAAVAAAAAAAAATPVAAALEGAAGGAAGGQARGSSTDGIGPPAVPSGAEAGVEAGVEAGRLLPLRVAFEVVLSPEEQEEARAAPCTMHHASCTMHHAPCTMHHAPCTMHHVPCATPQPPLRFSSRAPCQVGLDAFEEDIRGFLEDEHTAEISLTQALAYLAASQ